MHVTTCIPDLNDINVQLISFDIVVASPERRWPREE